MNVTITVGRFDKEFEIDYHTLHAKDWNEVVRELLDYEQDAVEGNIIKK